MWVGILKEILTGLFEFLESLIPGPGVFGTDIWTAAGNGKIIQQLVFVLFLSGFLLSSSGQSLAQASGPDITQISPNTLCTDLTSANASQVRTQRNLAGRGMRNVADEIDRIVNEIVSIDSQINSIQRSLVEHISSNAILNSDFSSERRRRQIPIHSLERLLAALKNRRFSIESELAQLASSFAYALATPQNYPDEIVQYGERK